MSVLVAWSGALLAIELTVDRDFVQLHAGPGRGYPIEQIALKGETLQLLKQRTQWVKVAYRQQHYWLHQADLAYLLYADSQQPFIDKADSPARSYLLSAGFGDFAGTSYYQLGVGYAFTPYIQAELLGGQASGVNASYQLALLQLSLQPWPEWMLSPYLALGGGVLITSPRTVLVKTPDRETAMASVELGLRYQLNPQYSLQLSGRRGVLTTKLSQNEETTTWLLVFKVHF
ncbi:hypothetical protein [Arsukibacterium sp.]|uniref:hypothetical protein n=1 Tax=Arsukibacterium sp. TaxID=1977258 RepID=UPI002FDAC113